MKKGIIVIIATLCMVLLTGCVQYERVDEVKLIPESELQSVTYKIWAFPNLEISINGDSCMYVVDGVEFLNDNGYNVYPYDGEYVGILEEDNAVDVCSDFLPIYGGTYVGDEFFPEFDFDSRNNIYYKDTEEISIRVQVDEEGYITYYKAEHDELGLLFEMYNFNTVDFTVPDYQMYTSMEFVLSHYETVEYEMIDNEPVFENDNWTATIHTDTKSVSFDGKDSVQSYTYLGNHFSVLYNEAFITLDDIFPNENDDKEFFRLIIEIFNNEKNIIDYFELPEIENNYTAPGSSN